MFIAYFWNIHQHVSQEAVMSNVTFHGDVMSSWWLLSIAKSMEFCCLWSYLFCKSWTLTIRKGLGPS